MTALGEVMVRNESYLTEQKFHLDFNIRDAISQRDLGQSMFLSFDSASLIFDTAGSTIPNKVPKFKAEQ